MPLSHRLGELMSVMQADDPDTIARGPFPRAHGIPASMRRAEIQKKGDFGRGDVALLKRHAKVARTREVSVDIGAKAGIGPSLHCLPLAQFGFVFAGFHEEDCPLIASIPQESRLRVVGESSGNAFWNFNPTTLVINDSIHDCVAKDLGQTPTT